MQTTTKIESRLQGINLGVARTLVDSVALGQTKAMVNDVAIPTDDGIDAHLAQIARDKRIDATLRSWRNAASSFLSEGDKSAFLSLAELVDSLYESTYGRLA